MKLASEPKKKEPIVKPPQKQSNRSITNDTRFEAPKARKTNNKQHTDIVQAYQQREKELLEKLRLIEAEKKAELKAIRKNRKKARKENEQMTTSEKGREAESQAKYEKVWEATKQEVDSLKEENQSLRAQNDKLKKNRRHLRINNGRLEKSQEDHNQRFAVLQEHFRGVKGKNEKLLSMEKTLKLKVKRTQTELDSVVDKGSSEHKLSLRFQQGLKKLEKTVRKSGDTTAAMKMYECMDLVDQKGFRTAKGSCGQDEVEETETTVQEEDEFSLSHSDDSMESDNESIGASRDENLSKHALRSKSMTSKLGPNKQQKRNKGVSRCSIQLDIIHQRSKCCS